MPDGIRWVGLDVYAHESTIAIFDQGTGELTTRRVGGRPHELMAWLGGGPGRGREAGRAGGRPPSRADAVAGRSAAASRDGVRGGADRVWARASRAGGEHRAGGVRARARG